MAIKRVTYDVDLNQFEMSGRSTGCARRGPTSERWTDGTAGGGDTEDKLRASSSGVTAGFKRISRSTINHHLDQRRLLIQINRFQSETIRAREFRSNNS